MSVSRRAFLVGGAGALAAGGCRSLGWDRTGSDLRFGVVSDIHVTTPASAARFESALRFFRSRGADAVVVPGDLTDWGLFSSLQFVRDAWLRVFGGTDTVPLFCTGNHDFEGWRYGDMTMEMHASGYSENEALVKLKGGVAEGWSRVFGEDYAPVRERIVKGYSFISSEWREGSKAFPAWMAENGSRVRGRKPFFYFQHVPIGGTTVDAPVADDAVTRALAAYPNAIAFTGHTHRPFYDEREIFQGAFTAIAVPSLSYAGLPPGHENGEGPRNGQSTQAMAIIPCRRDLRGGQGYFVSVSKEEMVVERLDFQREGDAVADAWVVPLLPSHERPYALQPRAAASEPPAFPADAELRVTTRNTENRQGRWTIVLDCTFPSALPADGGRVFDYEIRAVPQDGTAILVKRFLSPAYAEPARAEPAAQRFWFDVAELPQGRPYVIEVRARNCFGKTSEPLVSSAICGKPGLGQAKA